MTTKPKYECLVCQRPIECEDDAQECRIPGCMILMALHQHQAPLLLTYVQPREEGDENVCPISDNDANRIAASVAKDSGSSSDGDEEGIPFDLDRCEKPVLPPVTASSESTTGCTVAERLLRSTKRAYAERTEVAK